MDNFHIEIVSEGPLRPAMEIAFARNDALKKVTAFGYIVSPVHGLIFMNYSSYTQTPVDLKTVPFPFDMDAIGAADFAERWLKATAYPKEPGHDGHNKKGWTLYNDGWGQVDGISGSFVAVKPSWAMYGK